MACYVDPLMNHGWRLGPSCHLWADTLTELRRMAAAIGMRRGWEQGATARRPWAHYDLVAARRAAAVQRGAIECSRGEAVKRWSAMTHAAMGPCR